MTRRHNYRDVWADYVDRSANRHPSEFFEHAMATIDGKAGAGRVVVDLGCGAGVETRAFLEREWSVIAIDCESHAIEVLRSSVPQSHAPRLEALVAGFGEVDLPAADLVYAQLSLPFAVERFEEAVGWALDAVRPGGWFVGQFLGLSDSWARENWVTAVTRDEVGRLLEGFDRLDVTEEEFDGDSSAGPKHWHWFRVEARRTSIPIAVP